MKTLFVTGGAGFIGSNFIRFVLDNKPDYKIINLDALTYAGNLMNLDGIDSERHLFVKGNITDRHLLDKLFSEHSPDAVINFAAESHVDRSIINPNIFIETNVLGTAALLEVAKKHWQEDTSKIFLQVSTDEVYGTLPEDDPQAKFTEDTPLNPHSPYSASKAGADHLVQSYHDTFGMSTIITRCSNNYGPYQFPEKLIPLIINNARSNRELPVYGDGKNVRDWLYVEDHCSALVTALEKGTPGHVYNIGGDNEMQNIEIIKILLKILGKPESLITFVKDRPGHDRRYAIDATKAKNELGWLPRTISHEGLEKTVNWYINNNEWMQKVVSGEYIKYYEEQYKK